MKFQLRTALWSFALLSLVILMISERARHNAEIESLRSEIKELNEGLEFAPNYADLDVYVPATANGRIDDAMIYKYILSTNK